MNTALLSRLFPGFSRKARTKKEKWRSFFQVARRFFPYLRKQRRRLIIAQFMGVGYSLMGLLEPWPLKLIFDNVFLAQPVQGAWQSILAPVAGSQTMLLYTLIGVVLLIAVLRGFFYYFNQLTSSLAGQYTVSGIRVDLYSHLQNLSFSFHDRRRTGDLLSRLTLDIRILRDMLISMPMQVTGEILLMIGMVIVMMTMDPLLTLVSLAVLPVMALLLKRYRQPLKHAIRRQREREGHLASIASEVLGAIRVVQGFHRQKQEVERFSISDKKCIRSGLKAARLEAKLKWASEATIALITAVVLFIAARRVLAGALTPGDLLVFMAYLRAFNRPLRRISRITERTSRATASGERILDLLDISSDIVEKPNAVKAERLRGEIAFRHVCFHYKGVASTLSDINLVIKPGERVGIIGHTGSGKSSLVNLVPRFYDVTSGQVLLDGTDVRDYTIKSLRNRISMVFQEPILFAASIAENIAYGCPGASEEDIRLASRKAGIDEIIEQLPEGYHTLLGERGGTLSGGQRQCVAIARAIIKKAPIVILDEPSTGLDPASRKLVMNALNALMRDRTVLMISHDRTDMPEMTRTVTLSEGRLVADEATPLTVEGR